MGRLRDFTPRVEVLAIFALQAICSQALCGAPSIFEIQPTPGFITELTSISVTFSEPVAGVRAEDLLLNGTPATVMDGGGAVFRFSFTQPRFGPVDVSWGTLHSIVSAANPLDSFDGGASGSTWSYQLVNPAGPLVTRILPPPGTSLQRLGAVEVLFDGPVAGVDASDLRLNGVGASSVTGVGAGPYLFSFQWAKPGTASLEWSPDHGIATDSPLPSHFMGTPWTYTLAPDTAAPDVVISELMAENLSVLLDEDGNPEDWIELRNRGTQPVDLGGWSLSVDREDEGQWVFPPTNLPAGGYLLVWASGKDRRTVAQGQFLHTNFKLNVNGDTLKLSGPELPRTVVDELTYPEQSPNYTYGRQGEGTLDRWTYLREATPGAPNSPTPVTGKVDDVHFSVQRGFFGAPFRLSLATRTADAEIRYTLDGSPPSEKTGLVYSGPILIDATRIVRAAAFAPNQLPSGVKTHTYLVYLPDGRRLLPVLSLVTAAENLYGTSGIMEYEPRNTIYHGSAWERPVSVEWMRPQDNGGFQVDAGIRVAGGDYIRTLYNYRTNRLPESKYSFRLYFRGAYGAGRLNFPVFPGTTLESYNNLHLRAGMNDPNNPFLKDEFVRQLDLQMGRAASHGTFVNLFLNGVYKGIYNPCERVDDDFLEAYQGGGELWDVIGPGNDALEGDLAAWDELRAAVRQDLTVRTNYLEVARRMDLVNFIDYLLPLIWADNDDWPHNNTRAAREKKVGAPFRFYTWDSEYACTKHPVTYDTIAMTLSNMKPPWGTTDYQAMFNSLKISPEFRLLFADRVHRAFFNDGPLTDPRIQACYDAVRAQVAPSITSFNDVVGRWIIARRPHVLNSFLKAGFLASSNAPVASQHGGRVPSGYSLGLRNISGAILYTTNGTDPRVAFTGERSSSAMEYQAPLVLTEPVHVMARTLDGGDWSALIDLSFEVDAIGSPVRITEIMYNPAGGGAFEYIELANTSALPVDLSGWSFDGIGYRFPTPFPVVAPGTRLIVANDTRPEDFQRRYPAVKVAGWFSGALNNAGERIALRDTAGQIIASAHYNEECPWPAAADGAGSSLEINDPLGDPDDASNWHASAPGGSPGSANIAPEAPAVRINEVCAGVEDWLELHNPGPTAVQIGGWSLTDNSNVRQFVFPDALMLPADGFLQVKCDSNNPGELTAPFQLDRQGETVALFDRAGARVDTFRFGPVPDGYSVGLVEGRRVLCETTPGTPNMSAAVGEAANLRINEFLANSTGANDWIEIYNAGRLPIALQGCGILTDNGLARIASAAFIEAGGFVAFWADEEPGPDHLTLKLPAAGGKIALLNPQGGELDAVTYTAQWPEISSGRWPDGDGPLQNLPAVTRAAANTSAQLGTEVRISEVLARANPGPDWIEIENVSGVSADLAGFSLGIEAERAGNGRRLLLPNAPLQNGGRLMLYFGALPIGFVLEPGSLVFTEALADDASVLTLRDSRGRVMDQVEYGPQVVGRSFGRTDLGWALLASPTPGQMNAPAAELDVGAGLRVNEWLASGSGVNEFVELYNSAPLPVSLEGWGITDDPSIYGMRKARLAPLTFIDAKGFVAFHTEGAANAGPTHLPFRLDRLGESIRLVNPAGKTIDSLDLLEQLEAVSEGRYPDGSKSFSRFPSSASPAAANYVRPKDADGDGIDDEWEMRYGLDPNSTADAESDADGDGMTNLEEFLSGTHPMDGSSLLRLDVMGMDVGEMLLRFVAQANLAYTVQYTDALSEPEWRSLAEIAAGPSARDISLRDSDPAVPDRPARFYRVITRP